MSRQNAFKNYGTCNKFLLLFLILLLTFSSLVSNLYAKETIKSAAEVEYPPFSIVAGGEATGFSVELLRKAAEAMGHDVTFRTGVWKNVRTWLENGEVQALPLVGRTPEREDIFDFTFPYMTLHGAIVVRENNTDIKNITDLKGRSVGVMKGDNAEEFLRRDDRGIDIHPTDTFEDALVQLSEGKLDAVVIQKLLALKLMKQSDLKNLRIIRDPGEMFEQDFCFAVKEGDSKTLALLNEGLSIVMVDGTYRRLHAKWFATLQIPVDRPVIVGGDKNYPPFEYLDEDGEPAGFNVDLTKAIAREMGIDIRIRLGEWSKINDELRNGKIDILQGAFYSTERDKLYDFSQPHMINSYVSVVRSGEIDPPSSLKELKNKQVVVQEKDIMHDYLQENNFPPNRITTVDSQEKAMQGLANGKYDAALVARVTAFYLINKHNWKGLNVGNKSFISPRYSYAVLNGNDAVLAKFSEGLNVLKEKGEYRKIYDKWMGVYTESLNHPQFTTVLLYVSIAAAVFILIFLLVLLWLWSLRKQVAIKTKDLQESETKYRDLFENAPVGVFRTISNDGALLINPTMAHILGFDSTKDAAEYYSDLKKQLYRDPSRRDEFLSLLKKYGSVENFEYEAIDKAGDIKWVNMNARLQNYMPDGSFIIEGFATDVTERKNAEMALRESERQYHALFESIRDAILVTDTERNITDCNEAFVELFGYSKEEIRGQKTKYVYADENEFNRLGEVLKENINKPGFVFTVHYQKKSGEIFTGETSIFYLHNFQGQLLGFIGVIRDISEKLKAEKEKDALQEQLNQSQKMEAVGRLAGGVAHDNNNILTVILNYAELALQKLPDSNELNEYLKEIKKAAERSAEITKQLLAFARKQTIDPKSLNLNNTIEDMLKMLSRLIGEDIDLAWRPGANLRSVKMDSSQLNQMLANLCVNAKDAINGVGNITIETENVSIDEEYCRDNPDFFPGDYVLLAVSDDGCGMDRETQKNLFEPFFTTKPPGEGTGLGMAMVYGIVKQNGGFINVYSEPGKGSTFKIYLRCDEERAEAPEKSKTEKTPAGKGETILLVEDEGSLLDVAAKMLETLGYKPLVARNATEAIEIAGARSEPIDLLVTDVVMPGMNGKQLAEKVKEYCPGIKILFMSGYTANVIAHRGVLEKGVNFIQKPFFIRDLGIKIRGILDS